MWELGRVREHGKRFEAGIVLAPNPVAVRAVVRLVFPSTGAALVALYDVLGREAALLRDGHFAAGEHALTLDASGLLPGIYIVRATGAGLALGMTVTVAR